MAFDRDKFKALVHYVCWSRKDAPSTLGAVKLNKALWLSDFRSYYANGDSITGARYVKRAQGPVPQAIVPILKELEEEGVLSISEVPFHGYMKKEYSVHKEPDTDLLSREELALTHAATSTVCDQHTATSISEASHDHIWRAAKDGEEIPYFTVFALPGKITQDDREWALQELESMGA